MQRAKPSRRGRAPNIPGALRDNLTIVFLCALAVAGVFWGGISMQSLDIESAESLAYMMSGFSEMRSFQTFRESFTSSLISTVVFLGVLFVLGCCAIAPPFIAFAAFFKGLGAGLIGSFIFARHGTAAAPYFLVILLPHIFLGTLLVLFAARTSMNMSMIFFRFLFPSGASDCQPADFRSYCVRYAVYAALAAAFAFADALISTLLLPHFML